MKIENIKTEDIKPYPGNAKAHPREQIKKIARSIREYGFQVPILLDKDNVIIAGHGRLLAAGQLKMATVPAVRMDHLTEAQIKAFRLMDNRSSESDWLPKELAAELKLLSLEGFDLELTGFDGVEIEEIEELEEKEVELKLYKKTHILLSFSPAKLAQIEPYLHKIIEMEGIEYEQSSN